MNSKLPLIISAAFILASGCKNSFDEPSVSRGTADFTSYVAIGGYFTSGYGDGAMHLELQQHSFPAILASRFALAGGGPFKQPLVNPGNGMGYDQNGNFVSRIFLTIQNNCLGVNAISSYRTTGDASNFAWIGPSGPYNNLGVPGAKVFNLFSQEFGRKGSPNANPFFSRFASDNIESSTVIDDADRVNPTFFTFWIGSEDLWLYAKSGGAGRFLTDTNSVISSNDITPVARYRTAYQLAVAQLTDNNEEGALASIPDIESIPYFTAIPYDGLVLTQQQADDLNASTAGYEFVAGANAFVVLPPNTSNSRQLGPGELVLMTVPFDSILCYGLGTPQHPIPDYYILDSSEVANVHSATMAYNSIIASTANTYDLAFVDMSSFFKQFSQPVLFNGVPFTTNFLRNSIFSTDGLYPNARGNAHITNEFIRAINAKYQSTIPEVDINDYPGNNLP
ncbi:MAG: hypothetical protein ABI772_10345 [Bacteroidota bacterium]